MIARPERQNARAKPAATDLAPIVRLWMLRMLVPLNGQREFVNSCGLLGDGMAAALGLSHWLDAPSAAFDAKRVRADIRAQHVAAEKAARSTGVPEPLRRNMARLGELIELTDIDQRILSFAVMLHNEPLLSDTADHLGKLSSLKTMHALSVVLDLPEAGVCAALEAGGVLARSGLLALEARSRSLVSKLNLLSDRFAGCVLSSSADPIGFLRDTVVPSPPGHLALQDFDHLAQDIEVLVPHLRKALAERRPGVNILLHGKPGTGKSQLAKALAAALGCALYEVSSEDTDGDPISGGARMRAYRAAQCVLSRSPALVLFDEVEDIFPSPWSRHDFDASSVFGRKAWINRALETNPVPAFWLTNAVEHIDAAFIRRFDIAIQCPVPPTRQREKIARAACAGLLDDHGITRLASCDALAPAVVTRAASVVRFVADVLPTNRQGPALQRLVDGTLRAQGHAGLGTSSAHELPQTYDPAYLCTSTDLTDVAQGVARAGSARICLHGPPGTGKTAWARWLALRLDRPLLVKRASDLLSMWLGETEKQIAQAFKRAQDDGAVLLIDEVDSFLQDRRGATHSWEVTQVNELLTQMEAYNGIFIASTNLMAGLDEASLRRFDLKVAFHYLGAEQAWALFVRQAQVLGLDPPAPALQRRMAALDCLTPGDFAAVARQHRFRPLRDAADLADALAGEVGVRRRTAGRAIGFVPAMDRRTPEAA